MAGFGPDTLTLLRRLSADPRPDTFARLRADYDRHWLAPARAFVDTVGPRLDRIVPGLQWEPRVHGSILHPRQDVRFVPDRPLYRDHVGILFWEGPRRSATSVLFLRVHADSVTLGAGARRFDAAQLRGYREAVCDPTAGAALVDAVAAVRRDGWWPLEGRSLVRGPRTHTSTDPSRAELLQHTALWAAADLPQPGVLGSTRFADWCVRRWAQLVPLHRWLSDHVAPADR